MKKAITILFISLLSCINAMAVQSGKCGDNATWVLSDDSVLTISGTGIVSYCGIDKNKVKKIIIGNGITIIGKFAFQDYGELTEVIIPNSVTVIGEQAFWGCSKLRKVTNSDSLKKIGWGAFAGCKELQDIKIPNTVKEIVGIAFVGCDNMKYNEDNQAYYLGNESNPYHTYVMPKSINIEECKINDECKIIPGCAFSGCEKLKTIIIPMSITNICSYAFNSYDKLKYIICKSSIPPIIGYIDSEITNNATLYVPKESIKAYKKTDGWRNFKKIQAIENED